MWYNNNSLKRWTDSKTARRFTCKWVKSQQLPPLKANGVCENTEIPHAVNLSASDHFEIIIRTCGYNCKY